MAAVWCHWCHVMERTTYRDPAVLGLIGERFIPVRVDQDSHPALSYRYESLGWPATVTFDAAGNEIFRRRGYLSPELFAKLLQAVIDDPSALPGFGIEARPDPNVARLSDEARARLESGYLALYDRAHGGFGEVHRFLHADTLEYAIRRGREGNAALREAARRTLAGARKLIDPEWGGMHQYSDALDWSSPHYEKIMSAQLAAIRSYALAHGAWGDAQDLSAARAVHRFLRDWLRAPEGAFHVSQDADLSAAVDGKAFFRLADAERRRLGIPRIDRNLYARENGWAIAALAALFDVTGEPARLREAEQAAEWAITQRRRPGGAFGHGRADEADAYLADSLAMGEAFLALHRSTGARRWLALAAETGHAIARAYVDGDGGFMAQRPPESARGVLRKPVRQLDENVAATRFFNLLRHYTGDAAHKATAERGMAWLVAFAAEAAFAPGILLADDEIAREPVHVTVVGAKHDPAARALHAAARRFPDRYLRVEWWDRREGALANPDVEYPELPEAAAFTCANKICSLPVLAPEDLAPAISHVARR